ncbi:hypothetical protein BN19_092 [Streptococcus phage SP-QS1]|uniref:Uncharacterized protein n=1 Tax=Streptococcus phage SP-QS1 TaxID=1208587 RepID=S6CRF7_9CAUD|nr:hypothetical protein BN19_092 [Streptococcus phage SP-QS1]CCJ09745.1 hypothetical protein BN19_092 [Streptococcus phage SP-QS1]
MECLSDSCRNSFRMPVGTAVGTPYRGFSRKYKSEAYNVGFPKNCVRWTVARPARPRKSYPLPFPKTPARRGHACALRLPSRFERRCEYSATLSRHAVRHAHSSDSM